MELTHTFTLLRRYARHLGLAAILGALAGFAVSSALPKQYESQATVLVGQALTSTNPDLNGLEASLRLSQTYAQLATTRPRLAAVIQKLKLDTTEEELAKRLNVEASSQGPLIHIVAQAGTPAEAAAIANQVAAQLIEASPALTGQTKIDEFFTAQLTQTQQQIVEVQKQLDQELAASPDPGSSSRVAALQSQLTTLRATYAGLLAYTTSTASNTLTVAEPAVPNPEAASPRPLLNASLAAILAVILAIGLVVAHEQLDDSFKTSAAVEEALGLPVLGTVPVIAGQRRQLPFYTLDTVLFPRSRAAEAFRTIRTNLDALGPDGPPRSILVTSAIGDEGKTKVAANLAIAFAQSGRQVILVDADLRRSTLHETFRLDNTVGLSSLVRNPDLGLGDVTQTTEVPNLRIITAGQIPPDPAELLGSAEMRSLLVALGHQADVVIIDSSPVMPVTDPAVLSSVVDAVILVVRAGKTRPASARASRAALTRVGGRVIGAVLNGTHASGEGYDTYGEPDDLTPATPIDTETTAAARSATAVPPDGAAAAAGAGEATMAVAHPGPTGQPPAVVRTARRPATNGSIGSAGTEPTLDGRIPAATDGPAVARSRPAVRRVVGPVRRAGTDPLG